MKSVENRADTNCMIFGHQELNENIQFMQEQPRVLSSPQYLQPVEQKDYQYIPTHQTYFNQPAPANGTLSVILLFD